MLNFTICLLLSIIAFTDSLSLSYFANEHSLYDDRNVKASMNGKHIPYQHTVIWMGTQEGLAMQLLNLELLWNIAIVNEFNILVVSFHNRYHYADMSAVRICDYIDIPIHINIRCLTVHNRTQFLMNKYDANKLYQNPLLSEIDIEKDPKQQDQCVFVDIYDSISDNIEIPKSMEFYRMPRTYNLIRMPTQSMVPNAHSLLNKTGSLSGLNWDEVSCVVGSPTYFLNRPNSEYALDTTGLKMVRVEQFDSNNQQKAVVLGANGSLTTLPTELAVLPIRFKKYHLELFVVALKAMGWVSPESGLGPSNVPDSRLDNNKNRVYLPTRMHADSYVNYLSYIGVHWRRADQSISRCASALDTSVNCKSPLEFIKQTLSDCCGVHIMPRNNWETDDIKSSERSAVVSENSVVYVPTKRGIPSHNRRIYVSTNEKKSRAIVQLRKPTVGNMKTFVDTSIMQLKRSGNTSGLMYSDSQSQLSSVDRFVIEVILLTYAEQFIKYGFSSIHDLVHKARRTRFYDSM